MATLLTLTDCVDAKLTSGFEIGSNVVQENNLLRFHLEQIKRMAIKVWIRFPFHDFEVSVGRRRCMVAA